MIFFRGIFVDIYFLFLWEGGLFLSDIMIGISFFLLFNEWFVFVFLEIDIGFVVMMIGFVIDLVFCFMIGVCFFCGICFVMVLKFWW